MDKNTLSNYGWIVIAVLVLSVMIALATPFGSYIENGVRSTVTGLFETSEKAMNVAGMSAGSGNFEEGIKQPEPPYNHNAPELHPTGIDLGNGKTEPQDDDTYEYGDYIYTYVSYGNQFGASTIEEGREAAKTLLMQQSGMSWDETVAFLIEQGAIQTEDDIWPQLGLTVDTFYPYVKGWSVKVKDNTKTEYGPILESVNGHPIVSLDATFQNCKNLIIAPVLPNGVLTMQNTFYNCYSLVNAPIIPSSVFWMGSTFVSCKKLVTAPVIPKGVISLAATFHSCESLTTAPVIPDSVIEMRTTFLGCSSLTKPTNIPSGVKDITNVFYGCTLMTGEISIPCRFADGNYQAHWPKNTTITLYHINGCDGSCGA